MTVSSRIEFLVPAGAPEGACRLCKARIVWVPGRTGMMPLDVASIRLVAGEDETARPARMAESHFAHCPKAQRARKRAQRALCRVRGCGSSIPRERHFCPACWAHVPKSVRALLADYAQRYGKSDERTLEVLRQACQLAEQRRRTPAPPKASPPAGLFGPDAGDVEDPG